MKSGRVKAIAVTSAQRSAALPDLPTIADTGLPGYNVDGWVGLFAPAGTPNPIIERLYGEVVKVLRVPEVKELLLSGGSEVSDTSITAMRTKVRDETAMWAKVIKSTGIKIE